ncbi:hypothetical protein DS2_04505 [Catenovulum agarivorans DS-2]|uniref:Agmatine deiminase n=1 Tax=Catenovulum agarivorans DS-2 TaxID=1328313 RepID=W7QHP8_9ALTE|nr:agmatine deiminase family protein [Catenovulum agarivorans]EWH11406.1 hypothetical protein DS2_04505 [Catenovulum agarivorans DS-2]
MNAYFLPPEWYGQDAIMLTWPHEQTDWKSNLAKVEPVYVELSQQICARQNLLIVCNHDGLKQSVEKLLEQQQVDLKRVHFVVCPTDDTWARDHGPITLINKQGNLLALDFTFNGWGNKFNACNDNQINQHIFKQFSINYQALEFVLEGGAIEADGNGCLMVTSECLLNPNRNPSFTKDEIEQQLKRHFGCSKVLWLEHGALDGDDTDAHIDTLARFAPANKIVYQGCDDPQDNHFSSLAKMKSQLAKFTNHLDQPYKLYQLPWPDAQYDMHNQRLPATYANFLIINGAVLLPVYGVKQDQQAIKIMQQVFDKHEVIPINCLPIIEQFGSLHCITMQLPQGFLQQV